MTVFQFTAGFDNQSTMDVGAFSGIAIPSVLIWSIVAVALCFIVVGLTVWLVRRRYRKNQAIFGTETLLVIVPKFRREEESERGPSKDQVIEAISAAESFFSAVGGLKAQKGFGAWLKGRTDEVSFEIVVEDKLIKFYVTVPRGMRSFLEQQLSAA